jgi:hypothetical protein
MFMLRLSAVVAFLPLFASGLLQPKPSPSNITIYAFTQTVCWGVYDPEGTLTAAVYNKDTGAKIADGIRDDTVRHPDWRFYYTGVPAGVTVTFVITLNVGGDSGYITGQDEVF